ncbi:MAG: helix-turn-helix transcriptional regulator [Ruminococcus flavefaciens]|nr:helix-turn-helix transcriptional regulator [Ruminococcus flavefaciens]
MKKYRSFEAYMYDNYCDLIFNKIRDFLFQRKKSDFLVTQVIQDVGSFELEDFHIEGVSFKTPGGDNLHFRLSLTADVSVYGRSRRDYETDSKSVWISVYFESVLKNGLHNVRIINVEEYSKEKFSKEKALDHFLVPYFYGDDADEIAEDFLREYCPAALSAPMPIPITDIVNNMGLQMYYAPLGDTVFGKTYFETAIVTIYTDCSASTAKQVTIPPGTILVNPDVYFMRNVGSANNTIIHECVHWKRHRMFFELKRLLHQEYRFISCESVETYGIDKMRSTPLDWIEWQANTLAPRILMPASTTKNYIFDRLQYYRQTMHPDTRDAEIMELAIRDTADFFQVSLVSAKLRAIELGIEQAHGVFVYIDGRYIPPFSFASKLIGRNGTFVIDTVSALREVISNPSLFTLYQDDKIVFVNNMLCLNTPRYIKVNQDGHPEMTSYALDHIDECCFLFRCKKQINPEYDDSYYRACFLCREITADSFLEADYQPDDGKNRLTEEEAASIRKIAARSKEILEVIDDLPGSFRKTVDYHIKRKGLTAEELSTRSKISTQTISELRNRTDKNVKLETLMKLFVGLNLNYYYCIDLMHKAKLEFPQTQEGMMFEWLVKEQTDRTLADWQNCLDVAGIRTKLYDRSKV